MKTIDRVFLAMLVLLLFRVGLALAGSPVAGDSPLDQAAPSVPIASPVLDQFGSNAFVIVVLQWLKDREWFPWVTVDTEKVNRTIAMVAAALIGLGIGWSYDTANHALTITGLDVSSMLTNFWYAGRSVATQQLFFRMSYGQPRGD